MSVALIRLQAAGIIHGAEPEIHLITPDRDNISRLERIRPELGLDVSYFRSSEVPVPAAALITNYFPQVLQKKEKFSI